MMSQEAKRMARCLAAVFAGMVVAGVSTGCATVGRDLAQERSVTVERVSSRYAEVSQVHVHLRTDTSSMTVYGELRKRSTAPWTLPGHVEVQILGPQDTLLHDINTTYHRKDKRSRRVWFNLEVPAAPPGSTVRVIHHPAV